MDFTKTLYASAPVALQHALVSLQGFRHNHTRIDMAFARKCTAELRRSQWWTPAEFAVHQIMELRNHLLHAYQVAPYYKRLFDAYGFRPQDIESLADLRKLPVLTKENVRANPNDFLAGGKPNRRWNAFFTSGTTGSPLALWSSRRSFSRIWSFVYRLREWAGLRDPFFPRRVQFTGRDIIPNATAGGGGNYGRYNLPGNALLLSTTHVSRETAAAYAKTMLRFKPELIDGYPSAILTIARLARTRGHVLPKPKAVITSAETLYDVHKGEIEEAFQCRVYNQYASSDTAAFICSCEHGRMHVNPEFGICEILDPLGDPARAGQEGDIVATAFVNKEQLFIRYALGDTAVVSAEEECPCGRRMPIVKEITGRTDDIIYVRDRGWVGRLDPVFKGLHGIIECQIIQEDLGRLKALIVPALDYHPDVERRLIANLRKKVGDTIAIEVVHVDSIPRSSNGKFRSVITLCRSAYPAMDESDTNG